MTIGIYFIEVNDLYYIGQSIDIERRLTTHTRLLDTNKHYNSKLQNAFNKYGIGQKDILQICASNELDSLEEYFIKEFDSVNSGYNILVGGSTIVGRGCDHPKSKYTKEQMVSCLIALSDYTKRLAEISDEVGISVVNIAHITAGETHLWLREEYPKEYNDMLQARELRRVNSAKNKDYFNKVEQFKVKNINTNEILEVSNIREFSRKYKVDPGDMSRLRRGIAKRTGSWTLYKDEKENI
jgi:group I intron endonuclease